MDRAARGDLSEPLALVVAQITAQEQLEVDRRDLPLPGIARQACLDPVHRPALAFGIQPNREHRSGAEGGQQRLRRRWPGILASAFERLVDQEPVPADAFLDLP